MHLSSKSVIQIFQCVIFALILQLLNRKRFMIALCIVEKISSLKIYIYTYIKIFLHLATITQHHHKRHQANKSKSRVCYMIKCTFFCSVLCHATYEILNTSYALLWIFSIHWICVAWMNEIPKIESQNAFSNKIFNFRLYSK